MVSRVVLLDTGPLGLLTNPKPLPPTRACRQWLRSLVNGGARIMVPEIADYELRRELLRANKARGLANLESLIARTEYLPITTAAMRQAAQFWAQARQQGEPTAGDNTIDGDMILAAQAATLGAADMVIATTNPKHITRFVPAALRQTIA